MEFCCQSHIKMFFINNKKMKKCCLQTTFFHFNFTPESSIEQRIVLKLTLYSQRFPDSRYFRFRSLFDNS